MTGTVILFIAVFIAIAVVSIYFGHVAAKKRREALTALAQQLGLTFDPTARRGAPYWADPFELFRRGHRYDMKNRLAGTWEGLHSTDSNLQTRPMNLPIEIFDYTYYTESRNSKGHTQRHYHTRTVLALELPEHYPGLTIKPDSALREFFEFIGGADIDFESDEFNKRFYVWSDNRKFAYDVVHARMMEFLLGVRESIRDLNLQIVGERAIVFRERKLKPDDILTLLRLATDFHAQIPDYIKKDYARR